jgi:hypothetical protein
MGGLTSARARTGSIRLNRESSIGVSAEAATLLDCDENLRNRLGGLISANNVIVPIISSVTIGLVGRAVGVEDAGTTTGCEV